MTTLFNPATVADIKQRFESLRPTTPLWGSMSAAQMLAHCSGGLEIALGDVNPKRMAIGRLLGKTIKSKAFHEDVPMRRNSPTIPCLVIRQDCDLAAERTRLLAFIDRFAAVGPGGVTTHPHAFFGHLTGDEWGFWMYKHLAHHLQQFGV